VKFEFIHAEKALFHVTDLCRVLGVSPQGYYAWARRSPSKRARRNEALRAEVRAIHQRSRGTYGSPRVHRELRRREPIGRNRIARLMREEGLHGRRPPRFRKTTDSNHGRPVARNVLSRDFAANAPDRKWVGDITYVWTGEGWLYLAVLIDLFSRRVVGWAVAEHMRTKLCIDALKMALGRRLPPAELIHHTDQGSQYASAEYQAVLEAAEVQCSMSRRGNCYDNAVAESFFATLKKELIHRYRWLERRDAKRAIGEYIEIFYNNHRLHSSIGYTSPAEFEAINSNPNQAGMAA
jgi:putative transposase